MNIAPFAFLNQASQSKSVSYIGFSSNNTSLTTYTFNNVNVGGPGLCVLTIHSERTGVLPSISSVTIGGVTATLVGQVGQGPSASFTNVGIVSLSQTATTANIVITFTTNPLRCGFGVWRIQNNSSNTVFQVQSNSALTGTGLSINFTSLNSNALGICAQTNGIDGTVMTWTNATEDYDTNLGAGTTQMSGADFTTTSSGNRTVSTSHTNSGQPIVLIGAVWD